VLWELVCVPGGWLWLPSGRLLVLVYVGGRGEVDDVGSGSAPEAERGGT
jgi:hypothetical protein